MTTNPCAEAYDAFTASLEPKTRDLVTKLMLHTRTRPDDPQMVGVCLTAIATIKSADAQTRMLEAQQTTMQALEDMKTDPRFVQGLEHVSALTHSLEAIRGTVRYGSGFIGIAAAMLGLCLGLAVFFAWRNGYERARSDIRGATHQIVCNDLNSYIADVSAYWRKKMRMPDAADMLANTYQRDCPR